MTNRNNSIISGFITNLGKYNEGELIGEWIDFPISDDELEEVLERIGVSSEPDENGSYYEEYFFTDWESEFCDDLSLGEFESIDHVNEIVEKIAEYEDMAEYVLEAFNISDLMENDPSDYILWNACDTAELGERVTEETGILESLPDSLRYYFDFEAYGRDFEIDSFGGWCSAGYIEYIG